MERTDELKERIRQQPLNDRLEESRRRIGDMCSKGRCPKMTIPVQYDDDDFYINTTLSDAQATIAALQDTIIQMGGQAAVLAKDAMAAKEQLAALQADNRTYINERHEHVKQIEQLQADLAQRTAELEAAKADFVDASTDRDDWITSWRVLQRYNEPTPPTRGPVMAWREWAHERATHG